MSEFAAEIIGPGIPEEERTGTDAAFSLQLIPSGAQEIVTDEAPGAEVDMPLGRRRRLGRAAATGAEPDSDSQEIAAADLDAQGPSADLVRVYLNGIGKTALLTAEQEVELSKRIEAGLLAEKVLAIRENPDALHEIANSIQAAKMTEHKRLAGKDPAAAEERVRTETAAEVALISELAKAGSPQHDRDLRALVRDGGRAKNHLLVANLRLVVSLAKRYSGRGMAFLDLIQEGNVGLVRAVEKFDYQKGFKFSTYATWWIRQAISRGMADQGRTIRLPVHTVEQVNKVVRFRRDLHQQLGRDPTNAEIAHESGIPEEKIQDLLDHARDPISLDMNVGDDGDGGQLGDFIEDTGATSAEAAVTAGFMHEDIEKVLGTLEPREAGVVRRRYGLDDGRSQTLDEIGQHFGVSRERVRQIERGAMEKLRRGDRAETLRSYVGD